MNMFMKKERGGVFLQSKLLTSTEDILAYEEEVLGMGFEGLILRRPGTLYKFGRSTEKEGALMKLKRFVDFECEIIGFEEEMENTNEPFKNEVGGTARNSMKAGMKGKGRLGSIIVRRVGSDVVFNVGTGFTGEEREAIWKDRPMGSLIKVKAFPLGSKDKPRHPVFLGFRSKLDLSY